MLRRALRAARPFSEASNSATFFGHVFAKAEDALAILTSDTSVMTKTCGNNTSLEEMSRRRAGSSTVDDERPALRLKECIGQRLDPLQAFEEIEDAPRSRRSDWRRTKIEPGMRRKGARR